MSVEKELVELRERLAKVEQWKTRKQEIEDELNKVWTEGGDELPPPQYIESEASNLEEAHEDGNSPTLSQ
jgi:ATP-binding cassette subfamily D (ALD) long-chain fatty acid import protein